MFFGTLRSISVFLVWEYLTTHLPKTIWKMVENGEKTLYEGIYYFLHVSFISINYKLMRDLLLEKQIISL